MSNEHLSATHPDQPRETAGGVARDFAEERLTVDPAGARAALDARLITAHEAGDAGALVRLYAEAADSSDAAGDRDAACFYLTHAYVFALECGAPEADALHKRLVGYGREE